MKFDRAVSLAHHIEESFYPPLITVPSTLSARKVPTLAPRTRTDPPNILRLEDRGRSTRLGTTFCGSARRVEEADVRLDFEGG